MNIAGYCSWGVKMLRWPQRKLTEAQSRMALSFFEIHPEYCTLRRFITGSDAPDLHEYLGAYEGMRKKLIEVFTYSLKGDEGHSV